MNLSLAINHIQWIPVLVTTLLSFALGMAWHQPFLFGKHWAKENNPNRITKKINAPLIFGGTAIMHLVLLASLSAIVAGTGAAQGALAGLILSLCFLLPPFAGTYLFAGRSLKLLALDWGMYAVLFTLSGLLLGAW